MELSSRATNGERGQTSCFMSATDAFRRIGQTSKTHEEAVDVDVDVLAAATLPDVLPVLSGAAELIAVAE